MSRGLTVVVALAAAILGLAAPAGKAAAHAFPTGARPAVGSTISAPPPRVVVSFDSPIESLFAKLQVLDSTGENEADGEPVVSGRPR